MKLITTLLSDESTVEADRQWARETLELIKFFDSEQDKAISFADSMEKIDFLMKEELERFSPFRVHLAAILHLRRFFQTKRGLLGLGLSGLQEGDEVWLLTDAHVPFILRQTSVEGEFTVVGGCFMYGFMNGEMLEEQYGVKENIGPITLAQWDGTYW